MSDAIKSAGTKVLGGKNYSFKRLDIFDQMVIAKRLMPAIKGVMSPDLMGAVIAAKMSEEPSKEGDASPDDSGKIAALMRKLDWAKLIPALADSIYNLSDDDLVRISRTSLKVVSRQDTGGTWSPIMTPQGHMMFDDIKSGIAMQLIWTVIEAHVGDFFSIAP